MPTYLGVDIGTSSAKAVLCDHNGAILGTGSGSYPIARPRPGWTQQDPLDWWNGAVAALRAACESAGIAPDSIDAIGLSGQMHGSVFLDDDALHSGDPAHAAVRPALLWNDQRTAEQCAQIESLAGGRRGLIGLVGNAALPGFTLPKVLWLREHEPDAWSRVARVCLPKDDIALRLTGTLATDVGDAAGTLLLNPATRSWSEEMVRLVGLDPSLLPPVHESGTVIGQVSAAAASATGLRAGTPVAIGSGDNQTGAVGAGVVEPGLALATLGTSGVIYAHADAPGLDMPEDAEAPAGRLHTMCAANGSSGAPGGWSLTGCTLSAAGALHWCRDTIAPGVDFTELMAEAEAVPAGCEGLSFVPHLAGERCPHPDPEARGAWIGLSAVHTRGHLVRSVVEGVSFTMGQILDIARGVGVEPATVRIGGGGAKSAFWRQMLADVFGTPIATTNTEEGPAFGAALLAATGVGGFGSVAEACRACVREAEVTPPADPARYAEPRARFERLYPALVSARG